MGYGPDYMRKKVVVVTGATSGIGLATVCSLVARGIQVIGVGRSEEHCAAAEAAVRKVVPDARLAFLAADLAAQRQINILAAQLQALIARECGGQLDVLINNAAAVTNWYTVT